MWGSQQDAYLDESSEIFVFVMGLTFEGLACLFDVAVDTIRFSFDSCHCWGCTQGIISRMPTAHEERALLNMRLSRVCHVDQPKGAKIT